MASTQAANEVAASLPVGELTDPALPVLGADSPRAPSPAEPARTDDARAGPGDDSGGTPVEPAATEVAALRAELARNRAELAAKDAELARLRAELSAGPASAGAGGGGAAPADLRVGSPAPRASPTPMATWHRGDGEHDRAPHGHAVSPDSSIRRVLTAHVSSTQVVRPEADGSVFAPTGYVVYRVHVRIRTLQSNVDGATSVTSTTASTAVSAGGVDSPDRERASPAADDSYSKDDGPERQVSEISWFIYRRYSEFAALVKTIKAEVGVAPASPLPPKTIVAVKATHPDTVATRKLYFNALLREVTGNVAREHAARARRFMQSKALSQFLELEVGLAREKSVSSDAGTRSAVRV